MRYQRFLFLSTSDCNGVLPRKYYVDNQAVFPNLAKLFFLNLTAGFNLCKKRTSRVTPNPHPDIARIGRRNKLSIPIDNIPQLTLFPSGRFYPSLIFAFRLGTA